MIERLRPKWSDAELKEIYQTPHDHMLYGRGHGERVDKTIDLACRVLPPDADSVADLSCGNAAIPNALGCSTTVLGDFAPGYEHQGSIEQTIFNIPDVDIFILSETLEHLDEPLWILKQIRDRAKYLVLTTPLEAWGDTNGEHYWSWDRAGVEELLTEAGFSVIAFDSVDSREYNEPYLYGIWVLS